MPSIADAVAQIVAAGLPILFIDTCILLDVIRLTPASPTTWVPRGRTGTAPTRRDPSRPVPSSPRLVRSGRMARVRQGRR